MFPAPKILLETIICPNRKVILDIEKCQQIFMIRSYFCLGEYFEMENEASKLKFFFQRVNTQKIILLL
jgi:hypothetical protein